jgi:hypothetical protein
MLISLILRRDIPIGVPNVPNESHTTQVLIYLRLHVSALTFNFGFFT